jgi:Polyketide cyclase / dehydrase and lipid transport
MKQVFLMVAAAICGVAVLFVVAGLILPNRWNVERSVLVHAPAARIHPFVEDLRAWSEWEQARDATLKFEYAGPQRGKGASRSYQSQYAGTGSTTITESDPERGVHFESKVNSDVATARGAITYHVEGTATRVTWRDEGELPLITGGYLRDSVEQGLTQLLEQNLNKLKDVAERTAP